VGGLDERAGRLGAPDVEGDGDYLQALGVEAPALLLPHGQVESAPSPAGPGDEQGALTPIRTAICELVEELAPMARRLGCEDELERAVAIADRGPSYLRQRDVVAAGGTLIDVVDSLVEELRTDAPRPVRGRARNGSAPR